MKNQRILKFRVWDIENKKLLPWEEIWYSVCKLPANSLKNQPEEIWFPFLCMAIYANTKYVVQQFTGLLDKDNNELYEGDLIIDDCEDEERENQFPMEIIFNNGKFCIKDLDHDYIDSMLHDSKIKGQIDGYLIGNIFENPELLNK
ncbi:MAG: YopX family protein [bacterium]|nr:YopX family protein [bacterium]